MTQIIIDLDAQPSVYEGWKIHEHQAGGHLPLNQYNIKLYLDEKQQNGSYIHGSKLRKRIKSQFVMNATMLDWYLANPEYIPEEWKSKQVFFWGTIYRNRKNILFVRYLCWKDGQWFGYAYSIYNYKWGDSRPAAVLIS